MKALVPLISSIRQCNSISGIGITGVVDLNCNLQYAKYILPHFNYDH